MKKLRQSITISGPWFTGERGQETFYPASLDTASRRVIAWVGMGLCCTCFLFAFAFFLLGFSVFMYFEGKKFGDNQFTIKLLPPPMPLHSGSVASLARDKLPV